MKKNLKKLIASILVALTVISVAPMSKLVKPDFDLFDTGIKASAAYSYPAYFEVTKSSGATMSSGAPAAVYHTEPNGDSPKTKISVGSLLIILSETINSKGHTWYKFKLTKSDGSVQYRWIWEDYVSYRGSYTNYEKIQYMETINGGKCWTKPWSDATSNSSKYSYLGDKVVVKISRKINRNGTIWYKVYNEGKYIFSDNLKPHTHTTSTISRTNYKSIDISNHSYTWNYIKCTNSTCPYYGTSTSKTITKAHNYSNGYCSNCGAWKVKSAVSMNDEIYVAIKDNVVYRTGPYVSCKTSGSINKGKTIKVSRKVVTFNNDEIWYKSGSVYFYSGDIQAHSSCSFNAGKLTKQPTCTDTGTKVQTCTVCGKTKTTTLKARGHTYNEYGCCARCGKYNIKSSQAINNVKYEIVKIAKSYSGPFTTCSVVEQNIPIGKIIVVTEEVNNGSSIWYKYDNNKYILSDYVKKHSHTYNSGTITKAATCTQTGTKKQTCTVCNATRTLKTSALGHTYDGKYGYCTRCKNWNTKSSINVNYKYTVNKASSVIHVAPYDISPSTQKLQKGNVLNITKKIDNGTGETWYKFDGGYIQDYNIYPGIISTKLNISSATIAKGQKKLLIATVVGPSENIVWSTSDSSIATVNSSGVVKGIKKGSCTITASANNVTAKCEIEIVNPTITLDKTEVPVAKGEKYQLNATVKGASKDVTWSTSNKSIATVSSSGVVKGVKKGTCIITASANGAKTKCEIKVINPTIALNETEITIVKGEKYQLTATVKGASKEVSWSTDNKSVATVNSSGVVKGIKKGSCTITASANGVKVICKIKVINPTITLNTSEITIGRGQKKQLNATVKGESQDIIWSSSDNSIATVNSSGVVKGIKKGTCIITASANGVNTKCEINVVSFFKSLFK